MARSSVKEYRPALLVCGGILMEEDRTAESGFLDLGLHVPRFTRFAGAGNGGRTTACGGCAGDRLQGLGTTGRDE